MFSTRSILAMAAMSLTAVAASTAFAADQPVIGLVTKTETNPFFVKMKEGAQEEAKKLGAKLLSGAGKADGDNAGQITAMENMIAAGAKTILITPSDAKAIVPAIKKARDKGVMVIALDLLPGHPVGAQRHNGFMKGFGLAANDAKSNELSKTPEIVCMADSYGDQAKAQTVMENCLQKAPDVNLVYTINEPAAAGAYNALKRAGKEKGVMIVSVDGGCQGIKDTAAGIIAATSQQYPLKMAAMGVAAGVEFAKTGKKASGYVDTGVTLIAGKSVAGVDSKDTKTGTELCWGKK